MPATVVTSVERFHINHVPSPTRALICLVTLTFWPWNWCAVLPMEWVTFLPILVFMEFPFSTYGPTPVRCTPRNIETLTFEVMALVVPSLKFISLAVRKILRTFGLSISRPGDLDLWPWNWCTLLLAMWATFLPISVFLRRFVLDSWANTCQMHHMTLRPWPWRSWHLTMIWVFVLHLCNKFELCRPSCSDDMTYFRWQDGRMEAHCTSNPWTYLEDKRSTVKATRLIIAVTESMSYRPNMKAYKVQTCYTDGARRPISLSSAVTSKVLGLSILELGRSTRQTDTIPHFIKPLLWKSGVW